MPAGSFDLNPVPAQIADQALPIFVCLYDPAADPADGPYTVLPNVRCLRIDYREGPEPPVARFQYFMDDLFSAALGWPSQFEQLWPIDAQGNYVVLNDDRLVVLTADPSGNPIVLFDGFAQVPQVDLSAESQSVTFAALSVAVRLWDTPIRSRIQRNGAQATVTDGSADVAVNLPTRFNPADTGTMGALAALAGYLGNSAFDLSVDPASGDSYPVFIDENMVQATPGAVSYWIVWGGLAYLLHTWPSPQDAGGNVFVKYPTLASLAALFAVAAPGPGGVIAAGASTSNMKIRDYDATNKAPPDVFKELCSYCGMVTVFSTNQTAAGLPQTTLSFQRRDGLSTVAPKLIYLAANGAVLNLAQNNATALHLARDCNAVVNQWAMESALQTVEITVYLAPLFQPAAGDQDPANVVKWDKANLTNATSTQRRMYRWYGADECGDGHWNSQTATWVTGTACDFGPAFQDPFLGAPLSYVQRYRPGTHTIISKDSAGKPLKAVLELCTGFANPDPFIKTGPDGLTWTTVANGWQLLDDRLGIEFHADHPNKWHTGQKQGVGGATAVVTIKGVDWLAVPDPAAQQSVFLRLTTVIEFDHQILGATSFKRLASPTTFARERVADGRDHFQKCWISANSLYWPTQKDLNGNPNNGTDPLVMRDDRTAARTHTQQLRDAHEMPTLAGSVTIPFITDYYAIGDRVKIVSGRNANLQVNVGGPAGELPSYPWVTAFAWDFQGDRQQTVLQFSDRRAEPQGV